MNVCLEYATCHWRMAHSDVVFSWWRTQALKTLNVTGEQWEKLRTTALLDLKPRSLGSCALVANSENMLAGKRGPEIDAHDTIFRHNTPVKGFAKVFAPSAHQTCPPARRGAGGRFRL
mmetsp:Transcript_2221/g.5576  ORF Transcript_2221/g.5576 Transcript_2221/m.5576 type:complete len:118 (+) Transcript_2221:110-463(+)